MSVNLQSVQYQISKGIREINFAEVVEKLTRFIYLCYITGTDRPGVRHDNSGM